MMLQKYEAEVRNHIKIEQQLKLHIEVLQDKLEDAEKGVLLNPEKAELEREKMRRQIEEDASRDVKRYKELLDLREKEVDKLQKEMAKLNDLNEELKQSIDTLEKECRVLKANRSVVRESIPFKNNSSSINTNHQSLQSSQMPQDKQACGPPPSDLSTAALLEEL